MSFRRLLTGLIGLPLALVLVLFAVANRGTVSVSFDPFSAEAPALAFDVPLFVVILLSVMLGVLVGGVAAWLRQGKWRKEAKTRRVEVTRLENENDRARRDVAVARAALPAPQKAA